ncbi:MAG: hypothetical protein E7656_10735 [Ruminococcaceae bacterium]|nr:hypothetical protein [Oscillospiraceae bacterium]
MDLVFIEKPILALLVLVPAIVLHVAAYILRNHKFGTIVEIINVAFHSAAIFVLWLMGGGFEDVLVFVLFSSILALLRHRPAPEKKGGEDK